MSLKDLKEECLNIMSSLESLTAEIVEAESLAIKTNKYTDVANLQKLKEWRGIIQGQLITNQNKTYQLRRAKKK